MWILMAAAVAYAAAIHGVLRTSEYRERKNPENKFVYLGTHAGCELLPEQQGRPRQLNRMQIRVEIQNTASFPISYLVENADTEVAGHRPPRTEYPKQAVDIGPGLKVQSGDEAIDMHGENCGRLDGRMNFRLKYGLKGNERYLLELRGRLDIIMTDQGEIKGVATKWD